MAMPATAAGDGINAVRRLLSIRQLALANLEAFRLVWRYRQLIIELVRRDLTGQYANQALGTFWVVAHPLALLAIYVFVFAVVLKVRIPLDAEMPRDYTSYILAGLVPWLAISQALARSTTTLISNANLVKQVIFPVEILPVTAIASAMVPLLISIPIIVGYQLCAGQGVPWTILLVPAFVAQFFIFMTGIAFVLTATTPFFRDLKDFITVFVTAGVYLIPAFYLPQWVPDLFRPVIIFNPFSYPIWVMQDMTYFGRIAHPGAWIMFFLVSFASFGLGYRVYRRLRPYFANVI